MSGLQTVGVVGAGIMGSGIAQVCASAGYQVLLLDLNEAALQRGLRAIDDSLSRLVSKQKLVPADQHAALSRIRTTTHLSMLVETQLVIEAATENLDIKRKLLGDLDALLPADAVLATNTSSLSITELAACTTRPQRFIGLHFFNPVPLMGLVEIIRALQTDDATFAVAQDFATRLGKTPVMVRNSPGFAVNRILCPMINEAIFALQEGVASAADIDAGMKQGCNHPIGPLALADMVGLDTLLSIMNVLHASFADPKYRPAPLLREMVAAGRLGRKSGQGFFLY